jgi:broad specificity phosphatase PhoE
MILVMTLPPTLSADETTSVVFLVRHAEKELTGRDPELSPEGRLRARELASLFADSGIQSIYSSDYLRTRETARPLAEKLGLGITLYDPSEPADLVARLQEPGGRRLVVGHSNTVPDLVERLGGEGGSAIEEGGEYDRLYIVTLNEGSVTTVLLRYGKPFSP